MAHLTDTQTIILSAASQRDGHIALPLPAHLRGGAAAKVVQTLITKGFLEEVDADLRKGEPIWRETGDPEFDRNRRNSSELRGLAELFQ